MEITAGLDLPAAARDAEIDRELGAELERRLNLAHALGADADREEPATAQQRDRKAERPLPFGEIEAHLRGLGVERQQEARAQRQMRKRKDADAQRRDIDRVPGADPPPRDRETRRRAEVLGRKEPGPTG